MGVDGVTLIERDRIQTVLLAAKGKDISPALLGADYLLTGSVQLAGAWPDEKAKLRISAKIAAEATAKIHGEASVVLDGTAGEVFALETRLAEHFAKATGCEPTALQIEYREERNLKAKQLFGQVLALLQKA